MSPPNTQPILALATYLLPRTTPITTLTHPTDIIALVIHATLISLGFRSDPPASVDASNTSTDEETGEDDDDAATAVADDSAEPEQRTAALGVSTDVAARSRLPEGWNARGEDSYTFTYRHGQSQMAFTIKVGRMGGRVCVSGMAEVCLRAAKRCPILIFVILQDGEPHQYSILLSEYIQSSFLPWPRQDEPTSRQRPLDEAFTSAAKVQELVGQFIREIVRVLVPGIPLPGVSEDTS